MQNLSTRLLGTLGLHAVLGLLYWILVRMVLVDQASLSQDLLARLDGDPARIQAYLGDVAGAILTAGMGALLLSSILACVWLIAIHRNPPYGDKSARSRRGSWAALLIVALAASGVIFWLRVLGGPISDLLVPGLAAKAGLIGSVAVLVAYWISTALFAPTSTKVAVPGAQLISR